MNEALARRIEELPALPGVYIFSNRAGKPIYVGKAKSLRHRVRSYFQQCAGHTGKTLQMVSEIEDLNFIVTKSELDAFILEGNLIKKEKPRYNIVLRDDKNFPYLVLTTTEEFPRVALVRRAKKDGNLYFGPFLPAWVARRTLRMIPRYFKVAVCNHRIDGKRKRPCLYYHLDQCAAPCDGTIDRERYMKAVEEVRLFLEGRNKELIENLKEKMARASADERFEEAAFYRDTIRTIQKLWEKQQMVSVGLEDQDYFAHYGERDKIALQVFNMRRGLVQSRFEFTFEGVDLEKELFYQTVIRQYYDEREEVPDSIYVEERFNGIALAEGMLSARKGRKVRILSPSRGPKKDFLLTVKKNAKLLFESRFRKEMGGKDDEAAALAEVIGFPGILRKIEAFDISNTQGSDAVASLVAFNGSKPSKKDYRRFRIRTVVGPDDYAAMAEVVGRRYRKLLDEKRELPDFILIDGGRGQLSAALSALRNLNIEQIPVGAFEKGEEKLYLSNVSHHIRLHENLIALNLVRRIRDEAHRFAISYHRKLRSKRTIVSELTSIEGIGRKRAEKLLKELGSISAVRKATEKEMASIIGAKAARSVHHYFHQGL